MKIIERIKAKTPKDDKRKGKIKTVVATVFTTVVGVGLITNPLISGIVLLVAGYLGKDALNHAQQVEEEK